MEAPFNLVITISALFPGKGGRGRERESAQIPGCSVTAQHSLATRRTFGAFHSSFFFFFLPFLFEEFGFCLFSLSSLDGRVYVGWFRAGHVLMLLLPR